MSYSDKKVTTTEKLPPLPDDIRASFGKVLKVQSHYDNEHEMHYFLTRWLDKKKLPWHYDEVGNIIVVKGDADWYPCVIAHLDTVHNIVPELKLYQTQTGDDHTVLYAKCGKKKTGIGGDDKCGIFSLLYVLERFEVIKCVFFTKEEAGCRGSAQIDLTLLDDVGYVIQLDRWGRKDFICTDTDYDFVSEKFNADLKELKEQFGYVDASGLITDAVKLFRRDIGVCCINLSCGYYQHHSASEKIDLNQYWNALQFLEAIINLLGCTLYACEKKMKPRKAYSRNMYDSYDGEDYSCGSVAHQPTIYWRDGQKGFWSGNTWVLVKDTIKDKAEDDASGTDDEDGYFEKEMKALDAHNDKLDSSERIHEMTEKEYCETSNNVEWMSNRFLHDEVDEATGESKNVNVVDPYALMEVFNYLRLDGSFHHEEVFDCLSDSQLRVLGEEYFLWYGGYLFDTKLGLYLGIDYNKKLYEDDDSKEISTDA